MNNNMVGINKSANLTNDINDFIKKAKLFKITLNQQIVNSAIKGPKVQNRLNTLINEVNNNIEIMVSIFNKIQPAIKNAQATYTIYDNQDETFTNAAKKIKKS